MQAIGSISASNSVRLRPAAQQPRAEESFDETMQAQSRALVPIRPVLPTELGRTARPYPLASFLAHLIAVRDRAPQMRRRGRAAPQDASAAYAASQPRPRAIDHLRRSA
jgi:hypothetical protein